MVSERIWPNTRQNFSNFRKIWIPTVNGICSNLHLTNCLINLSPLNCADQKTVILGLIIPSNALCESAINFTQSDRTNYNIKSKFTSLKHKIQSEIRQAYNQYIHSIITDQPANAEQPTRPNKRFWTLIKQQKSDSKEMVTGHFGPCQFWPITKSAYTISAHRYNKV